VELIKNGKKTSTWRFFDDKNLAVGDIVTLVKRPELVPFGTAKIEAIIEKRLDELTEEDKRGHESYVNDEEMYKKFSFYYSKEVRGDTLVKILRFNDINLFE